MQPWYCYNIMYKQMYLFLFVKQLYKKSGALRPTFFIGNAVWVPQVLPLPIKTSRNLE